MLTTTLDAYRAAVAAMSDDDITIDGLPMMKPMNAALAKMGFAGISAAQRETFAMARDDDDAPQGAITITLDAAPSNPLPLFVHGVGAYRIRVGETVTIPIEAVDVLRNAGDVEFTIQEI